MKKKKKKVGYHLHDMILVHSSHMSPIQSDNVIVKTLSHL